MAQRDDLASALTQSLNEGTAGKSGTAGNQRRLQERETNLFLRTSASTIRRHRSSSGVWAFQPSSRAPGGIADQFIDFGRAEKCRVDFDPQLAGVAANSFRRYLAPSTPTKHPIMAKAIRTKSRTLALFPVARTRVSGSS